MSRSVLASLVLLAACAGPVPPDTTPDDQTTGAGGSGGGGDNSGGSGGSGGQAGGSGGSGGEAGGSGGTGGGTETDAGNTTDAGVLTAASCFANQYLNPTSGTGPNYDQFHPIVGSHCQGTNHQTISGIQRVVFLGDSVTVGTPPTNLDASKVYRSILSKKLATLFNLQQPGSGWGGANPLSGLAMPAETGPFVSCSKWGARVDDLMKDNHQIEDCIPSNKRNLKHLVVMTMGGNDIAALTKDGGGATPAKTFIELQAQIATMIDDLRNAIVWLKNPANVPGGVDVVFANNYEFTDGTGDTNACSSASLSGIEPWQDKTMQAQLVVWTEEQYLKIAKDTGSDMIFMLEGFCGHGYKRDDPTALCYRGPGQPLWFDATCIHPNADGHAALAEQFYQTIAE
jgi:lysophospholipase L1-like esterase